MSKRGPKAAKAKTPKVRPDVDPDAPPKPKASQSEDGPRLIQAAYFAMARNPASPGLSVRKRLAMCARAVDVVVDSAKPPTSLTKARLDQAAFLNDLWRAAIDAIRLALNPPSPLSTANAVRTEQDPS